ATRSSAVPVTVTPPERGSPTVAAFAAAQGPPGGGPGPGLLVALALGTALAGGGWLRLRSARRGRSIG
ncbi:MAG TPA: hypothetical protein VIK65_08010, partial [Candidatus Limnocylindrales bacterium]